MCWLPSHMRLNYEYPMIQHQLKDILIDDNSSPFRGSSKPISEYSSLNKVQFYSYEISSTLINLDTKKSSVPDIIQRFPFFNLLCLHFIQTLTRILNQSLKKGVFSWTISSITPFFESGLKTNIDYYLFVKFVQHVFYGSNRLWFMTKLKTKTSPKKYCWLKCIFKNCQSKCYFSTRRCSLLELFG